MDTSPSANRNVFPWNGPATPISLGFMKVMRIDFGAINPCGNVR